jgi:hypothetical protein
VQALVAANRGVLAAVGRAGELPLVTAERAGAPPELAAWLREQCAAEGLVWCGGPAAPGSDVGCGLHILVDAGLPRSKEAPLPPAMRPWDLPASLAEMADGNASFLEATRLNGLPFGPADIAQACVSHACAAFLLKGGEAWRLRLALLAPSEDGRCASRRRRRRAILRLESAAADLCRLRQHGVSGPGGVRGRAGEARLAAVAARGAPGQPQKGRGREPPVPRGGRE